MKSSMNSPALSAVGSRFLISCLISIVAVGCSRARPENENGARDPQLSALDSQSLVTPPVLGTAPAQAVSSSGKNQAAPQRPAVGEKPANSHAITAIPAKARRDNASTSEALSVASFLDRSLDAGQPVQVTGTCIDGFHARGSAGPPPVSRSDWQLSNGTQVVYVVGRMPASCASGAVTISAVVGVDTVAIIGTRRVRRFLVIPRQ